ncbi:glycosyltransferase [Nocardioides flavus (ex Wang et al. 2016)]|uniref:glycosyltransferase n=1 Tax=Nocardioides flavus (ex Wang et al. 2016) TaxID=2058780 RepID=UPI00174EC833|nr:glycosyltransferase family 2 protein [Nocardioides flavus (ex Wang et al. 2016)]
MSRIAAPETLVVDPSRQADVVVICVTYNSASVVQALLAALPAALSGVDSCRVVFIDNDSTDGTSAVIRAIAPWAVVIPAGGNDGYAAGINIALRAHPARRATYVLNPDTIPSPSSVRLLLQALELSPSVGAAVPRTLDPDGSLRRSLRREPTVLRALAEAIVGGSWASRFSPLGEIVGDPCLYADGAVADWATGAALFLSRSAIDAVGEWDERFFLYSEETDYCLRLRDAGFCLRLVDDAVVVHQGGAQTTSPALWALSAVNRTRLYRKRHGRVSSAMYWSAVLINEGLRALTGSRHRAAVRALLALGPNRPGTESTLALLTEARLSGIPAPAHR